MPEQYAIATLWVIPEPRFLSGHGRGTHQFSRERRVCEWPREDWEEAHLVAGPFDTLSEARAVAASSIPKDWASIVDRDGRS